MIINYLRIIFRIFSDVRSLLFRCYKGFLSDNRIALRLESCLSDLLSSGTAVVNQLAQTHSLKAAFYRMLSNNRLNHDDILEGGYRMCNTSIKSTKHVLCIQDTTEFNYRGIKNKLGKLDPDIGPTGNKTIPGFFCHPMLVVDAESSSIQGLSSVIIYNRGWNQKDKKERNYAQLPIQDKESYRWIKSAELSKDQIPETALMTVIGDRESDIYEEFVVVPDQRTHILVRSRADRSLSNKSKLYSSLDSISPQGKSVIQVNSTKKRKARSAQMEVSFSTVTICAPLNYKGEKKTVELSAILVRERAKTVPDGELPILWRLLTTHKIETIEQANQCIGWYKRRWLIEELFRVIKTKGFGIESCQLGSGASLKKILSMTLLVALKVMQLKLALKDESMQAEDVFSPQQLDYLDMVRQRVEGSTELQRNPYKKQTLAWGTWLLARLAGWSGYKSHGPPGYITIKDGFDKFNQQFIVYAQIMKLNDVCKD